MKKLLFLLLATCFHFAVQAQSVSSGDRHSLWLKCSGTIPEAFGYNNVGQLGNDTSGVYEQSTPVMINSTSGMIAISTGSHHSLFLKSDGTVWACGNNSNGELGDGTTINRDSPVQVTGLTNVVAISGGYHHSLFLKSDGTVWACGRNSDGQLGDGTTTQRTTAVQVSGLTNIVAIAGGGNHSLFLKSDSTVWACGENGSGQLGDGTTTQRTTAVQVSTLTGIAAISGGMEHSVFLKSNGTAWATGRNHNGQLGDGTTTNRLTAVQVTSLTTITALDAGYHYTLFLKSNGTAWGCGNNVNGQLGDGTNTNRLTAVQVNTVVNVASLSAGWAHSLFLLSNATVWACGTNYFGDLGDGTTIDRNSPVQTLDIGLPEINIKGNNIIIVDGDITPAAADHTNFGTVALGMSPSRTYTIQNLGTSDLVISSITSSNALFTIGAITPASPIPAGDSATFAVTFSPTTTGVKNGTITVNNNDCDESVSTFAIRGTGATTCPTLTFTQTHVEACPGTTDGSTTISGSAGGTGPYTFSKDSGLTYQSSNVLSNLAQGIYPIRIKDLNGCESAALAVNVNDLTPPTIICPADTTVFLDPYYCGYFPVPLMTDNCPFTYTLPATIAYRVNSGTTTTTTSGTGAQGAGMPFVIDTNHIYWTVTDYSGNIDSCVQTFFVYDTVAPLFEPVFNNYAFETATGVILEDLSTGATEIIPAGSDNVSSAIQQIPFYFDFHSVAYRDFSVSSNGLIGFGTTAVTTSATNSTASGQHNKIYALWDNLHTGTNGSVKYKVVGARPNRKLVIEFNVRNAAETGNYTKTFQVWLFETSHKVQLVYGTGTNMPSATIGVRGANATVYNDVTSSNHTASKTIINDANTAWPGSGRSYMFTPAIFAIAPAGSCSANVNYSDPNFIDCNPYAYMTYQPSGDNFPVGTTPLIFTVLGAAPFLNTATYSIPVIVEDTTLPVITCSGIQSFGTSPGLCTGVATITPPTVTDNCSSFTVNNALNFDGIDDLVKVASTSVISTASQNKRTVEVSFKVNDKSISSQKQVIWEEGGSSNGLNMYVHNGSLYYGIYSVSNGWTGTWLSTPNIVNGQWHRAVLVYDSASVTGRLKAYLDGNLVGSADSSATLGNALAIHNTGQNGIGALASNGRFHDGAVTLAEGHYFAGDIDELRIWNVARTPQQLLSTSLSPLTGNETGLVLYYNFNQGTACGNNTGVNSLDDITATNVNGVVTNMTLNGSCVSNWTTGSPAFSSAITLTNNFNNTSDASGIYPIGVTNVVWTASDASGNTVTCTQDVIVSDVEEPVITAPPNQVLSMDLNTCTASYNIQDPISDNCLYSLWGYDATGATVLTSNGFQIADGSNSGALTFNKGITTVNLIGSDGSNWAIIQSFTVTVNDNQAPTLVAPANQTRNVIANTCAANYNILDPMTDNCSGATWGYSTTGATVLTSSGNTRNDGQNSGILSFNKGVTTVTLTGTDGTNAATSVSFTITVNDNQAPIITCPAPGTYGNNNLGYCGRNVSTTPPTVTDNCDNYFQNNALNYGGNSIVKIPVTSVINTAAQSKRTVEVSFKVVDKSISSYKQVIWDEGGAANGLNIYIYNGSLYYGIYSELNSWDGVWLSTTNIVNNQWHHAVLVFDGTIATQRLKAYLDGVLVAQANSSANLGTSLAIHINNDNAIGALTTNGKFHDGDVVLAEGHYFNGDIDELRLWNVARTAAELASTSTSSLTGTETGLISYYKFNQGNACSYNYGIDFLDDQTSTNLNGVLVNFDLDIPYDFSMQPDICASNWTAGAPAFDGPITLINNYTGKSYSAALYPAGTTTVIMWTATDQQGNTATCTDWVYVQDDETPTIDIPLDTILTMNVNTCMATYTILDPVYDNCSGALWGYYTTGATVLSSNGDYILDGSNSDPLLLNKGITSVVFSASDTYSGTSTWYSPFNITVNDNQAPTLIAPSNQTLNVITNTCAANYTIADPLSDNCTGATWGYSTTGATVLTSSGNTRNDGQNSGNLSFNKGITTVTLTATDGTNAATTVTFTVTVNDNQGPTLIAPSNQTLNVITNTCAANYTIADPLSDNCTGATWGYTTTGATVLTSSGNTRNDGQSSGVLSFNKGITTVTLTGTDGTNLATTITFTVTVNDNQNPTLTCFTNQVLSTSTCSANYTIVDPVSDNCSGAVWGYSLTGATQAAVSGIPNGTNSNPIVFFPGVTTVSLHAVDASGNTAVGCTRTVTVNSSTCTQTVNLTLFLQGFYNGSSTMQPALLNQGVSSPSNTTDTITVSLIASNGSTMATQKTIVQTNGTATCTFFPAHFGYYYIAVKHRNSIETYSSNMMLVDASTTYDFSNSALKAYGNNQIQVGPNVWAFYSGDINQDGAIDAFDYLLLDPDITIGASGYLSTDLNGDGYVDAFDYLILDPNLTNGVGAVAP